jgi:hypothetical protein
MRADSSGNPLRAALAGPLTIAENNLDNGEESQLDR